MRPSGSAVSSTEEDVVIDHKKDKPLVRERDAKGTDEVKRVGRVRWGSGGSGGTEDNDMDIRTRAWIYMMRDHPCTAGNLPSVVDLDEDRLRTTIRPCLIHPGRSRTIPGQEGITLSRLWGRLRVRVRPVVEQGGMENLGTSWKIIRERIRLTIGR